MLTVLFSTHSLDTYREMGRKTRKDRETPRTNERQRNGARKKSCVWTKATEGED